MKRENHILNHIMDFKVSVVKNKLYVEITDIEVEETNGTYEFHDEKEFEPFKTAFKKIIEDMDVEAVVTINVNLLN